MWTYSLVLASLLSTTFTSIVDSALPFARFLRHAALNFREWAFLRSSVHAMSCASKKVARGSGPAKFPCPQFIYSRANSSRQDRRSKTFPKLKNKIQSRRSAGRISTAVAILCNAGIEGQRSPRSYLYQESPWRSALYAASTTLSPIRTLCERSLLPNRFWLLVCSLVIRRVV